VLNGDSLCEASLTGLLDRHAAVGAAGTLLLTRVEDSSRYGSVALDEHGAVTCFEEKRAGGAPAWINAGVYAVSLERDVLPAWVGRGLYGFAGGGRFLDIGVPADHARAADFLTAWNAR
jgi:NDP-sugar pyrophosphorylase family protein